jgi:hypothetical protein
MLESSRDAVNVVSWELDDGEALHREAPSTFAIPSQEQRQSLAHGDVVKLIFRLLLRDAATGEERVEVERMWVIVQGQAGSLYSGVLDNDPYCTGALKSGATVRFEPRHVIQVYVHEKEQP